MNKNILLCLSILIATPYAHCAKDTTAQTLQITFHASHGKQTAMSAESEQDFQYCVNILRKLSDVQKKRKLTVEEMLTALQVVFFLFGNNEDDAKRIEILLNSRDLLVLPYSSQLLGMLNQQISESDPSNAS